MAVDSFKEKMTSLGYVEGQNIIYDINSDNANYSAEKEVASKFLSEKVDLIVVMPTEASISMKHSINGSIPIVFTHAFTEGVDLIDSISHPGINITGVKWKSVDIASKGLEIMHELIPAAKRFYVPYDSTYPSVPATLAVLRPTAERLNLTLVEAPVKTVKELEDDINARYERNDSGVDAIISVSNALTASPEARNLIKDFSEKFRLPSISSTANTSVFTYSPDAAEGGVDAAILADKILRGTPAGSIPVMSLENKLVIYYKNVQNLGINISQELLARADDIIR